MDIKTLAYSSINNSSRVGADKLLGDLQLRGLEMGSEAVSLSRYILDQSITLKNIIHHT